MIGPLIVAYPTVRAEPTEDAGPRLVWSWTVRGIARQGDGWATSRVHVWPFRALPVAIAAIRAVHAAGQVGSVADLEEALRGMPQLRLESFEHVEKEL